MYLSLTLHIVDLCRYYVYCAKSGVTRCTLWVVLYLSRMCRCVLRAVLWSYIGILMRLLAAEPRRPQDFIPLSVSLWNDIGDPVFDGVAQADFKSRANSFLLAQLLVRSLFLSYCFPLVIFYSMGLYCGTGVLGLMGVNHSLPAFHCQPFLIVIIKILFYCLFLLDLKTSFFLRKKVTPCETYIFGIFLSKLRDTIRPKLGDEPTVLGPAPRVRKTDKKNVEI